LGRLRQDPAGLRRRRVLIDLTQLDVLTDKNREAATALVAVLDHASEMEIEPEALEYMASLVLVFRSERFRDVALPEQQLAGRFIIGRLALYRMAEYGEVQPD
jgi:hypothetical protein